MATKKDIKTYNTRQEKLALYGAKKEQHKKWKNIAKELSDRHISLGDISDPSSPKQYALMDIAKHENLSLGELTVLRQFAEAIYTGSTRAAEFVRDTMGEKPTNDISLTTQKSPIEELSDEDLAALLAHLKEQRGDET